MPTIIQNISPPTSGRLSSSPFGDVDFGWWDYVKYFIHLVEDTYAGYSWQIWTSFHIVLGCSAVMILGFALFWYRVYSHNRSQKKERKARERFIEIFSRILGSDQKMSRLQIWKELNLSDEEIKKNPPTFYANILEEIRINLHGRQALPNMQPLAMAVGVTDMFTENLLRGRKVFRTLQMMLMLQVTINEGRLSKYRNHKNPEIRMMARLNYIMCTDDNPYLYLEDELRESKAVFEPMLLHYIFGWMAFNKRRLPNFVYYVENCRDKAAAFMLREIRFWGTDEEKAQIKEFLRDERVKVRQAAITTVSELADHGAEDTLTEIYPDVSESLKQDILRALLSLNSGRQKDFFRHAYDNSSSRQTQVVALQCMFQYGAA